MFDEPKGGKITLKAANDLQTDITAKYTVEDLTSGQQLLAGECSVAPDSIISIADITETPGAFYLIKWSGDAEGVNHYAADIYHGLDFGSYVENMKKAGFGLPPTGSDAT